MMLTYFLICVALIWLIVATIWDFKKREVPDWLNFSLIAIALFARLLFSVIEKNLSFFLWGLFYFVIFLVLANLFYYSRVFAGGDAKLLIGIGIVLAEPPKLATFNSIFPLPFTFIINLLFIGSIYGLLYMLVLVFKNKNSFIREFQKKKGINRLYLILAFILITMFILTKNWLFIIVAVITLFLPYLYLAAKVTEKTGLLKYVWPEQLTEGDWLAQPVKIGKKTIKPTWDGLTKKELVLLRKTKKKIAIKQGIPFVPAFLMAFVVSFFGNFFEILMALF